MIPAVRSQADNLGDIYSRLSATDLREEEFPSMTRQEFKDEADINILLRRYGVDTMVRSGGMGQEVDYTIDLQSAFAAIEAARRANLNVPPELRDKYPDWRAVLNGAETGEYDKDLAALAIVKGDAERKVQREQALEDETANILRRQAAEKRIKRDLEDRTAPEG